MNYIITIGHQEYLYKGDNGLATLLKALGNLQRVEKDYVRHSDGIKWVYWINPGELEVSVSPTTKVFPTKKPPMPEEIPDEDITEWDDMFNPPKPKSPKALPGGRKALPGGRS